MPEKETITLKNAIDAYLAHLAETGTKKNTISVYERALGLAIAHFGEKKKLTGIMVPHVSRFFDSKAINFHESGKPKAKPTIIQTKRVFRQCMQFAKNQGFVNILTIPKSELQNARSKKTTQEPETSKATKSTGK